MKAITCTQCGAVIDDVSEHSVIIDCDYCGARILLNQAKSVIEPPRFASEPPFTPSNIAPLKIIGAVVAMFMLIPILIFAVVLVNKPRKSEPSKFASVPSPVPVTFPSPTWRVNTDVPEKPVPVVNYQPRVSWDGPNDMEHFADPEVDISSVSHLTTEEVKKTVFKNRVVKLKVVINTEGEIDEVEAISGHPILVEAATKSARSSIFRSRSKPTNRVLTYTFRVLKDN